MRPAVAVCGAAALTCLLPAPVGRAQARQRRPPYARVAWSAPASGVRVDRVFVGSEGDLTWVGERGAVERRRIRDGALVAHAEELDCYVQEVLRAHDAIVVACLGGTGASPRHVLVSFDARTLRPTWRLDLGGEIVWPRVLDGGTLYAVSRRAQRPEGEVLRIVAIDAATGDVRFRGEAPLRATPCAMREDVQTTAELVVVSACRSGLAAFSRRDGALRWSVPAPELRAVLRAGDTLAAWTAAGRVDGLELRTGARRFRVEEPGSQAQPLGVTPGGDVLVQRWGRRLEAIDPRTGSARWSAPIAHGGQAWVQGDALVVQASDGVWVLDAATGAERARLRSDALSSVVVTEEAVLATELGRQRRAEPSSVVHALRLDGTGRWASPVAVAVSSPLAAGGRVFACSEAGELLAIDRATGAAAWRLDVGRNPATYAACELLATPLGVVARRGDELVHVANDPVTFVPPSVQVVGRVVGDVSASGVRLRVGDQRVRVDARGRFQARVVAATSVVVRVDPRDAAARCASADAVTVPVVAGRVAHARLELRSDPCACRDCD